MKHAIIPSPIGNLRIIEEDGNIIEILPSSEKPLEANTPLLKLASKEINDYLHGSSQIMAFPIHMEGTDFQKRVWNGLLDIPYGAKMTYGDLARSIGHPRAARAVGNALNKNRILLRIPCHRIVDGSGGIGGFGCGETMKRQLMGLEGMKI